MSIAKTIALHKALGGGDSGSGAGAGLVVTFTGSWGSSLTPDKAFNEVWEAIENGTFAYALHQDGVYMPIGRVTSGTSKTLYFAKVTVSNYGSRYAREDEILWNNYLDGRTATTLTTRLYSNDRIQLQLCHDDDSSYADSPSGVLSALSFDSTVGCIAECYEGTTFRNIYTDDSQFMDVILLNGDPSNDERVDRYEPVSASRENVGEENETITIVFQNIGIRNGSAVLKRVTVSGGPWDGLDQASVTYSETAL